MRYSCGCFSSASTGRTKLNGATFILFLDCVWQIQNQFICSFEFLPSLLIFLFEHLYASEYGNFKNCIYINIFIFFFVVDYNSFN